MKKGSSQSGKIHLQINLQKKLDDSTYHDEEKDVKWVKNKRMIAGPSIFIKSLDHKKINKDRRLNKSVIPKLPDKNLNDTDIQNKTIDMEMTEPKPRQTNFCKSFDFSESKYMNSISYENL